MTTVEQRFRAMGCDVRVAARADARDATALTEAAVNVETFVCAAAARLTRFDATSELRRVPSGAPASPLLRRAIAVALGAARASGGLLDPLLGGAIAEAGYATTFDPRRRAELADVLAAAPRRRPARPRAGAPWTRVSIDGRSGHVALPRAHATALDLGATAKGLIADLALRLLGAVDYGFVDAGGDLAIRASAPSAVLAADPFGRPPITLQAAAGMVGVATSSIAGRCWWQPDGTPAHHLLDPSTGEPAFTGVVQVTAAAPTTAEAERIAGHALLSGPLVAPQLLTRYGGVVVLDDATVLRIEGALLR